EREGALRAPRHLHALPGGEVLVDLLPQVSELFFERRDFFVDVELLASGEALQLINLLLQLDDRLLEVQGYGSPHVIPPARGERDRRPTARVNGPRQTATPRAARSATEAERASRCRRSTAPRAAVRTREPWRDSPRPRARPA